MIGAAIGIVFWTVQIQAPVVYTATTIERMTAYAPMAANPPWNATINGTACIGVEWFNCKVQNGDAACSYDYPLGTVLFLPNWVEDFGISPVLQCVDRGGKAVRIEAAIVSANPGADLELAFAWGVQWVPVLVVYPAGVVLPPKPGPGPQPDLVVLPPKPKHALAQDIKAERLDPGYRQPAVHLPAQYARKELRCEARYNNRRLANLECN